MAKLQHIPAREYMLIKRGIFRCPLRRVSTDTVVDKTTHRTIYIVLSPLFFKTYVIYVHKHDAYTFLHDMCAPLERYTISAVVILWQWDQSLGERERRYYFILSWIAWNFCNTDKLLLQLKHCFKIKQVTFM